MATAKRTKKAATPKPGHITARVEKLAPVKVHGQMVTMFQVVLVAHRAGGGSWRAVYDVAPSELDAHKVVRSLRLRREPAKRAKG